MDNPDFTLELARRVKAAVLSCTLGRAGVDSTLKRIPKEAVGKEWVELTDTLMALARKEFNKLATH